MNADKKIDPEDLPRPEKEKRTMQPEEFIQTKGNLEADNNPSVETSTDTDRERDRQKQ